MIRIVLQSEDLYFLQAFSDYASAHCPSIEFVCFSSKEKALQYLEKPPLRVDALLAPSELLDETAHLRVTRLAIAERTSFVPQDRMSINIYQSGPAIISDIKNALAATGEHFFSAPGGGVQVVAGYSVEGGSGKTTVSYALAATAVRQGRQALYVNLEPFPAYGQLYDHKFNRSMDDILFALKSGRDLAPVLLDTMERNEDNVMVLPPFSFAGDLLSLTKENLAAFVKVLTEKTNLDYVFIDLPTGFQPVNLWALEQCTCILLVYSDTPSGREHREKAQNDLYFKNLPLHGGILTLLNHCRQKAPEEGVAGKFPVSESLQQGRRIGDVLDRNPAFLKSCIDLLVRIDKGEETNV